jgi:hypothetical protein
MLATFMQKWARRYIKNTQPSRYSPHKRARLRAFFSEGVEKWHVSWAVETLPILLHISFFLFCVGLIIFLFSTNHVVFGAVVWWPLLSMMAYLSITLLPLFWPNSPYDAPLSSPIWYLYGSIRFALINVLSSVMGFFHLDTAVHFRRLKDHHCSQFFENIGRTAEEIALKQTSEIDFRVLLSTFDAHDEAGAQEEFFGAIPGFFASELVGSLEEYLTEDFRAKFSQALNRFLDRTLSLSSVCESVRSRRLVIFLNAAHAALGLDGVFQILRDVLNGRWPELIQSIEMVQSLRHWSSQNDEEYIPFVQRIVAQAVVDIRERDDRWISLVKAEFAVPDRDIRSYISHGDSDGDSVLLFILIHVTRQAFHTGSWPPLVLSSLSEFSIRNTLPGLQHTFCALWNDILFEARDQGVGNTYVNILREIRHAYINLHLGTDAAPTFPDATYYFHPDLVQPSSYRYCNIACHRHDWTARTLVPPSPTQFSESPTAFPHSSPSRRHRPPGGSTITLEPFANHTPHHTQGFSWSSPIVDLVHIYMQAPSISSSSDPESIGTDAWDPDRLAPGEASAPSAAEIAASESVRSATPPCQIHTNQSGETSQAHAAPPLIFQHFDPVPATITPSTGPGPGDDDPDALQGTTSSATLSHPLEGNKQQDTVTPCIAPDITKIQFINNPIPRSTPTASPTVAVSDSPSSPILLPAHYSDVTTAEPPLFVNPAPIHSDQIAHAFQSPPSPRTTASSHDTHDPNLPIPMTALLNSGQTAPPAHDIAATTSQPDEKVQHGLDKS